MSAQVIDYSTLTDRELDVEIAKRLGLTFRDWDGLEICKVHDGAAHWVFKSYATDANAALELVLSVDYSVSHRTDSYFVHMHGHQLNRWNDKQSFSVSGIAKTFSRAICECWLYLQDAKR